MLYLKHHEELWFEDGKIVLVAEDRAFKVHRGIPSVHFVVYRDMFQTPQPSNGADDIEKCPSIRLYDSPERRGPYLHKFPPLPIDVIDTSTATTSSYFKLDHTKSFNDVRSILLLAMNHNVQHIANEAIGRLRSHYPSTSLAHYDRLRSGSSQSAMTTCIHDSIATVNLARLSNLSDILPLALYNCCRLSVAELLDGVPRSGPGGPPDRLSEDDLRKCSIGRDASLLNESHRAARMFLHWHPGFSRSSTMPQSIALLGFASVFAGRL
ncbi:hypothetical protein PHLCEN_2v11775 [Hermanssonia centrifuga]|uniref:Uncharacterized protein n=1 Tax=Hermanssonia centrifuga TaxID=98765 RepID=A0A2R6NIW6_9APHY|nr:hypothetical protein PHLCEN_2v11775 [Hermanssonia centrifuga]